jgi:hypothetical protein
VQLRQSVEEPVQIRTVQNVELTGAEAVNVQIRVPEPGATGSSQVIQAPTPVTNSVEIRQIAPVVPQTNVPAPIRVQIQPN